MKSKTARIAIFGDDMMTLPGKKPSKVILKNILKGLRGEIYYISMFPGVSFEIMRILAEEGLPFIIVLPDMTAIGHFSNKEMEIFNTYLGISKGIICVNELETLEKPLIDKDSIHISNLDFMRSVSNVRVIFSYDFEPHNNLDKVVTSVRKDDGDIHQTMIISYQRRSKSA